MNSLINGGHAREQSKLAEFARATACSIMCGRRTAITSWPFCALVIEEGGPLRGGPSQRVDLRVAHGQVALMRVGRASLSTGRNRARRGLANSCRPNSTALCGSGSGTLRGEEARSRSLLHSTSESGRATSALSNRCFQSAPPSKIQRDPLGAQHLETVSVTGEARRGDQYQVVLSLALFESDHCDQLSRPLCETNFKPNELSHQSSITSTRRDLISSNHKPRT